MYNLFYYQFTITLHEINKVGRYNLKLKENSLKINNTGNTLFKKQYNFFAVVKKSVVFDKFLVLKVDINLLNVVKPDIFSRFY